MKKGMGSRNGEETGKRREGGRKEESRKEMRHERGEEGGGARGI